MDELVGVLVLAFAALSAIVPLARRVFRFAGRLGPDRGGADPPADARSLQIQRELQAQLRAATPPRQPVAPPAAPAPSAVKPAAPAPRPAAARARIAPAAVRAPRGARVGIRPAPALRPLRINTRLMGRMAVLSEIWRPPLALRNDDEGHR